MKVTSKVVHSVELEGDESTLMSQFLTDTLQGAVSNTTPHARSVASKFLHLLNVAIQRHEEPPF